MKIRDDSELPSTVVGVKEKDGAGQLVLGVVLEVGKASHAKASHGETAKNVQPAESSLCSLLDVRGRRQDSDRATALVSWVDDSHPVVQRSHGCVGEC